MSKLDKDAVIAAFTDAYTKANGKAPQIEAKGGWYSVDGGKNIRLAQLNDMIAELGSDAPAKAEAPAKAAAPAKKAAPKAAKKAPAKPAAKKAKGGFSVKDFWADKIMADNKGANLPR